MTLNGGVSRSLASLALLLAACSSPRSPYAVGAAIPAFEIEDQHGMAHGLNESVEVVLFSRDMKGGDLLEEALMGEDAAFLERHQAVYIADISGMPAIISRLFALPSLRERPYPILLDRDGSLTGSFPDVDGEATLIFLESLRITRIEHLASSAEVRAAIQAPAAPTESSTTR